MGRLRLVYFYGSDGVGKTTHAKIALYVLRRLGIPAVHTNLKLHHTLSYFILKLVLGQGSLEWYLGFPEPTRTKIRRPLAILEILSTFIALFFRIILFWMLGYTIVCDRYVIDTLVTLSAFLGDRKILNNWFAETMLKTIPHDSLLIHLDSDANTILSRKKDEPLTRSLINYYRKIYHAYTSYLYEDRFRILVINTSRKSILDTAKKYLRILYSLAKRR